MLSALKLPGFRWIAAVYALDYLIELASSIALMVLVYDATDSAVAAAAMLICKQVIPGLAAASLGTLLERHTVRQGLVASYCVLTTALGILAVTGYGAVLFVLAAIAGAAGAAIRALLRTSVARSTGGHDRRAANGFLNVLMGALVLLGPAAGAVLTSTLSISVALATTAGAAGVMVVVSAALPRSIGAAGTADADDDGVNDASQDPRSPAGRSRFSTASLLTVGALMIGLFAMDEPALLAYSEHSLEAGVGGYGAILTAWGLGMVLGSLLYGRLLGRPMTSVFIFGASLQAVGYVGLGVVPNLAAALCLAALGGVGNGMMWVSLVTAIQESARPEHQARTAARLEGIVTAAPGVGFLLGGVIAEQLSPRATLFLPGVLALMTVLIWSMTRRPVRSPLSANMPHMERPADVTAV